MSNITAEEREQDKNAGVNMVLVAGMLAEYGGRMLKGNAKFALKSHVNNIINSAAAIERLFIASGGIDLEERKKFKELFAGNIGALFAEHVETLFGLNEESMEVVMNVTNRFIQASQK